MNAHGTTYYVIRSLVRFLMVSIVMTGLVVGVPLAVNAVWPALILASVLWTIVAIMFYRERKRILASAES